MHSMGASRRDGINGIEKSKAQLCSIVNIVYRLAMFT